MLTNTDYFDKSEVGSLFMPNRPYFVDTVNLIREFCMAKHSLMRHLSKQPFQIFPVRYTGETNKLTYTKTEESR